MPNNLIHRHVFFQMRTYGEHFGIETGGGFYWDNVCIIIRQDNLSRNTTMIFIRLIRWILSEESRFRLIAWIVQTKIRGDKNTIVMEWRDGEGNVFQGRFIKLSEEFIASATAPKDRFKCNICTYRFPKPKDNRCPSCDSSDIMRLGNEKEIDND